jgi:hypothetical protein
VALTRCEGLEPPRHWSMAWAIMVESIFPFSRSCFAPVTHRRSCIDLRSNNTDSQGHFHHLRSRHLIQRGVILQWCELWCSAVGWYTVDKPATCSCHPQVTCGALASQPQRSSALFSQPQRSSALFSQPWICPACLNTGSRNTNPPKQSRKSCNLRYSKTINPPPNQSRALTNHQTPLLYDDVGVGIESSFSRFVLRSR